LNKKFLLREIKSLILECRFSSLGKQGCLNLKKKLKKDKKIVVKNVININKKILVKNKSKSGEWGFRDADRCPSLKTAKSQHGDQNLKK